MQRKRNGPFLEQFFDAYHTYITMVLAEHMKRVVLFEAEGYRPPTIAKMLGSEGIFVSRRGVGKFYYE